MNSKNIAPVLESHFPTPSLHLELPIVAEVEKAIGAIFQPLAADLLPKIPRDILNPASADYFERTRKETFGMSLSELEKKKGGDVAWNAAKEPIDAIAALLKQEPSGPFFAGDKRSYADVMFVTVLHFIKFIDQKLFDRFCEGHDEFRKIYDEYSKYFKRDDH
jgi:glutathione S-transferase